MRGRKPTETRILKLRGSRHQDKALGPEPTPGEPEAPSWLDKQAKGIWSEFVPEMARLGVITLVDRQVVAVFCQTVSDYLRAQETYRENPEDKGAKAMLNECRTQILRYAQEFGLTALARSRIKMGKPKVEQTQGKQRFFAAS